MKKTFALLLALAMVVALFAGCGGTASSAAPAADASASQVTEPADDAAPAADVDDEDDSDMEEASDVEDEDAEPTNAVDPDWEAPEITYPLVDEETVITYWQAWPPFLSAISEPQDAAMFDKLAEATGVRLEITAVSTETSADDFMLRCASGDLTDMIQKGAQHYTGGGAKAIEDEVLLDLLPLLREYSANFYGIITSDPNIYKNTVNDEGQIPALTGMYMDYYYTDQGFWIRQDFLDAVGKEAPTTIAELDDVLAAFKDYGLTDGLVVLSGGECDLLARAYDAADKVVDGKITWMDGTDNMKEYLKKMHEYYELGYINKDFVTYTYSDTKPPQDVIYNDMGGIFNEDVASIAGYYLSTTNPNFELAPLAQIRKEADSVLKSGYVGSKSSDKYSLSLAATCSDPELCIQYMDYLFSEEGFELANYGIEGQTFTKENGEYKFTDLILNNEQGFDWQLCQSLYINPGFPCLTDLAIQEMTYNDAQKAAVPTWVGAYDSNEEAYPNTNWLSYTTDESEERADLLTDLETYQEEMRLKFITGQADIDAEWDTYCQSLEGFGIRDLEAIDQASYDRYMAK